MHNSTLALVNVNEVVTRTSFLLASTHLIHLPLVVVPCSSSIAVTSVDVPNSCFLNSKLLEESLHVLLT